MDVDASLVKKGRVGSLKVQGYSRPGPEDCFERGMVGHKDGFRSHCSAAHAWVSDEMPVQCFRVVSVKGHVMGRTAKDGLRIARFLLNTTS